MSECNCYHAYGIDNRLTQAIVNGHKHCLTDLMKEFEHDKKQEYYEIHLPLKAALCGNLEMLKLFYQRAGNCMNDWTPAVAVQNDHLECLKFALTEHPDIDMTYLCIRSAGFGSINCLKYCHDKGGNIAQALEYAEKKKHLECVKYIQDHI